LFSERQIVEQLACRACRNAITSEESCSVCRDFKERNLVVPGELKSEQLNLGDLADRTARLLEVQIKSLQREVDKQRGNYNAKLSKESQNLSVALAKVLDNARKLHKEGSAAVNRMSFDERVNLMVEWYMSLPPANRKKVMNVLNETDKIRAIK
jgi:hypothetical protein